jgi:hypothetical protein
MVGVTEISLFCDHRGIDARDTLDGIHSTFPDTPPQGVSLTSRWFCKKARKSAVLMENVASTIMV